MSTVQVVTRWYRAPELLLLWDKNTHLAAFDIWSVGCILAELMQRNRRRPIFPGKSHLDQIEQIVKLVGTPAPEDIKGVDKAIKYMQSLPRYAKRHFFPGQDEYPNQLAVDLLEKMLTFNPEKRITIDEALSHPYLADIRDIEYEKTCDPFTFRLADETPTEELKKMIYEECINWNRERGIFGKPEVDPNIKGVVME